MDFTLYFAAIAADNAWQAELVRRYGSLAGDARYTLDGINSNLLRELAKAKHLADAEWRKYVEEYRRLFL